MLAACALLSSSLRRASAGAGLTKQTARLSDAADAFAHHRDLSMRSRSSVQSRLLISSAFVLLYGAYPSIGAAQSPIVEQAEVPENAILVTGSRILRTDGMETPVPVTAVDAAELQTLSPTSLVSSLSQLPQFYGNQTPASGSTRGTLNLRGLGLNRTLTLLTGRRVPGTPASGGADITLFPEALIRAVETTTGGAAAADGPDAVAGVVHVTLAGRFTGREVAAQAGVPSRGDGGNQDVPAACGTAFANGRGDLLLSGEYAR